MQPEEIAEIRALGKTENFRLAAEKSLAILKKNPDDKLAQLTYAQMLSKEGIKENLKPLLVKAEEILKKLIASDWQFIQAHDELIYISHRLGHLGELSNYYNEMLRKFPQRTIYTDCLKKISGVALLSIPEKVVPKKRPFLLSLFMYLSGILVCFFFVLGFSSEKFKSIRMPSILVIIAFIIYGVVNYFFKSREKWQR